MTYIEKNLLTKDEEIIMSVKQNGIVLFWPWVWGILGCWLLFIPTFFAIKKTVLLKATEYAVTNKKVIEKYGWISIQADEMKLSKIENLTITYSFWGKIFNYGTLCIQGTNKNDINFKGIKNVEKTKNMLSELLDTIQDTDKD